MARLGIGTRKIDITETFARVGNNLSADFANTIVSFDHDGGTLRSAGDVVDFLSSTEAIEPADAARLRARLKKSPADATHFLTTALTLRSAVTSALAAVEGRAPLGADALAVINAVLAADAGFEQLEVHRGVHRLERRRRGDDPQIALLPIAHDVAQLLATPNAPVRRCSGEGCVRYFYDDSRTGRRRWCEMAICGNRAKAATFAKRQRAIR